MRQFDVIVDQVRRRKEAFIQRLLKNTRVDGPCLLWTGAANPNGYAVLNIRAKGKRRRGESGKFHRIGVHRLFLMLKLCRPIKPKHEAGHYYCHNQLCVRHVEEQTRYENLKARDERQKQRRSGPGDTVL